MGRLQLNLLGTPEVRHTGEANEVLSFPTRKTLALLVYLAVEGGVHTREKLAAIFWPEHDTSRGRANLRNTLALLRNALQHDRDDDPSHLLVDRNTLAFDVDSDYRLDLEMVEAAVETRHVASLREAVDVYRGDFLDGFSLGDAPAFDDWASIQREKWHRRAGVVFDRLSQVQTEAGEIRQAVATVNRWLEVAPLSEAPYRRLMRLHFAAGERDLALRAYDSCREMLAEELGVAPTPETEAVAERIRSEPPPRRTRTAEPEHPLRGELPIVGREQEHTALVEAYYTVRQGAMQIVLLEGEAGIGKTRLANEFLAWAHAHDACVVHGRAIETGGRLPYQPIVKILRSVLRTGAGEQRGRGAEEHGGTRENRPNAPQHPGSLAPMWLAELSRLLPELRERHPDLPAPASGDAARTRLFEAAARLGMALAAEAPLVLFVDDLQWADTGSLDLLQYAAGRWHETVTPILLLLSVRSEALFGTDASHADSTQLRDRLTGLEREVPLTRLTLSPLTETETLKLVETLTGARERRSRGAEEQGRRGEVRTSAPQHSGSSAPQHLGTSAQFAEWLHAETEGHPFYVAETLETLFERELLRLRGAESGERILDLGSVVDEQGRLDEALRELLPPGVHRVIRARLDRLPRDAFDLLAAGAVLGDTFAFETLARVAGRQPDGALASLDDLLAHRLVVETGERDRPYAFVHDKIRDVVYTEAGDARRRLFHRRALETLQSEGAAPAELAHHALGAGRAEDAVRHSVAAGDDAMELFAVHDAIAHYETARQVVDEYADVQVDYALRTHLVERLGRACEIVGDWDRADQVFRELIELSREAGDAAQASLAHTRLAFVEAQRRDVEGALARLDEAVALAESSGDPRARAEANWCLALMGLYGADVAIMEEHGERALVLARRVEDEELIARCRNVLAYNERNQGRPESGIAYARQAYDAYTELNDLAMQTDCLGVLAQLELMVGRPEPGVEHARTAISISRDIDSLPGIAFNGFVLILGLLEVGTYGDALTTSEQVLAEIRGRVDDLERAMALMMYGKVQRRLLALDAARASHEEALRLSEAGPPVLQLSKMICMDLCADHALTGDWEAAHDYARRAPTLAPAIWFFMAGTFPWWLQVDAFLRAGERADAEAVVQRFEPYVGEYRRLRLPHLRAQAMLAAWDDDTDQAIACLQDALALAEEIGLPGEYWPMLMMLARLYRERGDDDRTQEARTRATETVRELAAGIGDQEVRATFLEAAPALQQTR